MTIDCATDVDDARFAGYQAARKGECYRHCPHPYRTSLRTAWLEGWRTGLNGQRVADPKQGRVSFRTGAAA